MYTIKNLAKSRRPSTPPGLKNYILGKRYNLSIVFAPARMMRNLNNKYRKKAKTADILSFPITDDTGEIFINIENIRSESLKLGLSQRHYATYILIHGMLHLKGWRHSSKMEDEERRVLRRFGFLEPK